MTARITGGTTRRVIAVIAVALLFPVFPLMADGEVSQDPLLIGSWRWLGAQTPVEEIVPDDPDSYVLTFEKDGRLQARLEANIANTTYVADPPLLTVNGPMAMTMAAWLPDSPAPAFLMLLENGTNYFFRDGFLYIDTFADGGTLKFVKAE